MSTVPSPANRLSVAANAIAETKNADVVLYAGDIVREGADQLAATIRGVSIRRENVVLIMRTDGGDADAAFKIARCLQEAYGEEGQISLLVSSYCKSAGTLVATGVDEIVMADGSELGPLDVQITKPDELLEHTSGLTLTGALNTLTAVTFQTWESHFLSIRLKSGFQITTRTAADIAAKMTVGLFKPIYAQIDPQRLGESQRAMQIAHAYGGRLDRGNLREDAIDRLLADYPSHGFVIDRIEAQELFFEVRPPDQTELDLLDTLDPILSRMMRTPDQVQVTILSTDLAGEGEDAGEENGIGVADVDTANEESLATIESATIIDGPSEVEEDGDDEEEPDSPGPDLATAGTTDQTGRGTNG